MAKETKNIAIVTGKKLHSFVISTMENGKLKEIAKISDGFYDENMPLKVIMDDWNIYGCPRIGIEPGVVETLTIGDYIEFREYYENNVCVSPACDPVTHKPRTVRHITFTRNLSHEERIKKFKNAYKKKFAQIQQSNTRKR